MAVGAMVLAGCASPGPPRPPSLQLPQVVRDLAVQREGDAVRVRFTVPQRTTDGLPIREPSVRATLCRGLAGSACVPVGPLKDIGITVAAGATPAERTVTWVDRLPAADTTGQPRLLEYRIELRNQEGRTAGWSDAAYTAAGTAPAPVEGLHATETRQGILLQWNPAGDSARDQVILRRETAAPKPEKAGSKQQQPVWLETHAANGAAETLDATAVEDTPYSYIAVRRRTEEIGARKVEVRSAASQPVEITWLNRFPPAAPAGLSAAPFAENGQYAVDLVWEPVLPTAGESGLQGYLVTRQALDDTGAAIGTPERLGMVETPAFHDATAKQGMRYRYEVSAVSAKGVEGAAATVMVSTPAD